MSNSSEGDLVARGVNGLLTEIVKQADDAVTSGEVRDLAEALAALVPVLRTGPGAESGAGPMPRGAIDRNQ